MDFLDFKNIPCFGIAGNFAQHLEQAGEASDFAGLVREGGAPKGIFPFYVPGNSSFLGRYPLDNKRLKIPKNVGVQAEPEIALRLGLNYGKKGICSLKPLSFMSFNDASVRGVKAAKISHKKNFSGASRGAGNEIAIDKFSSGGICDDFSLASFLHSQGEFLAYGECARLSEYGYFYEKLLEWIKITLNTQQDEAVLEHLAVFLEHKPKQILLALGATRYEPNMENRYFKAGDEVYIIAFNHKKFSLEQIKELAKDGKISPSDDISVLIQRIEYE